MDLKTAKQILNLSDTFDEKELKHNYFSQALKCHPDKSDISGSTQNFQELSEAYTLLKNSETFSFSSFSSLDSSYSNILEKFMTSILDKHVDVKQLLSLLNNKCSKMSCNLLINFSYDTLLKLQFFFNKYSDIFSSDLEFIHTLNTIINNYKITIIKPSLNNLINNEIYILQYENETYYIPTWHHELIFDISKNKFLLVQCEPDLPDYISIDESNNLYVNLSIDINSILNDESITINIGEKKFIIPINQLQIKKYQRYNFKKLGISSINTNDIFNIDNLSDIYINITFL